MDSTTGVLSPQAGVTLMEVLIAVTLLSLLSAGMLYAMRIGLSAFTRTDDKLMSNRRVAGAQRILEQEIQGLMPVVAVCGNTGLQFGFFQGEEQLMRLVSTFSLQQASRGLPQILELFVIPGEDGRGVRLVVNETPYTGGRSAGQSCTAGIAGGVLQFPPPQPRESSFVLADKLAYCRFRYFAPGKTTRDPKTWQPVWGRKGWPHGVRVEMAPLDPNPSRLQPITVTVPIYIYRSQEFKYADQ